MHNCQVRTSRNLLIAYIDRAAYAFALILANDGQSIGRLFVDPTPRYHWKMVA